MSNSTKNRSKELTKIEGSCFYLRMERHLVKKNLWFFPPQDTGRMLTTLRRPATQTHSYYFIVHSLTKGELASLADNKKKKTINDPIKMLSKTDTFNYHQNAGKRV